MGLKRDEYRALITYIPKQEEENIFDQQRRLAPRPRVNHHNGLRLGFMGLCLALACVGWCAASGGFPAIESQLANEHANSQAVGDVLPAGTQNASSSTAPDVLFGVGGELGAVDAAGDALFVGNEGSGSDAAASPSRFSDASRGVSRHLQDARAEHERVVAEQEEAARVAAEAAANDASEAAAGEDAQPGELANDETPVSDVDQDGESANASEGEGAGSPALASADSISEVSGFNAQSASVELNIARSQTIEAQIAAGDPNAKIAYLTFDDGPSGNTEPILSILNRYGVCGTWFVVGSGRLDLCDDIEAAGNSIGLHSYTHDYAWVYSSTDAYFSDLYAIQDALTASLGHGSNFIRFPGGMSNTVSANYCPGIMTALSSQVPMAGFQYFDWNVSSGDASYPGLDAATITSNVLEGAGGMSRICVLMHDTDSKGTTVEALPAIIEGLAAQGYSFGVMSRETPAFHHYPSN